MIRYKDKILYQEEKIDNQRSNCTNKDGIMNTRSNFNGHRIHNESVLNVWDKNIPPEVSSYVHKDEVVHLNYENLIIDPTKLTMIDLFCGAGGFSVGCGWSGFQAVLGIDHFKPAIETWIQNHKNSYACLGDIRNIDPTEIQSSLLRKGIEHVNLLTGGVPCQGFSLANRKHNDHDERNFLFLEYMRWVKTFQPDYIILENVSGLRNTAGGIFEKAITDSMADLGYKVTVKLINAADYGVPQTRERIIFVGVHTGRNLKEQYEFPAGKYSSTKNSGDLFMNEQFPYRTVRDAISDLPSLNSNESTDHYDSPPLTEYQAIMRGESGYIKPGKPNKLYNHCSPNHPLETIHRIENTLPGKPMYVDFKQRIRLHYDFPSPTQLAGGIRPQFQFGHPNQPRGLTIRERARIQSFPDTYQFLGGIVQERVQTGNAVPPLVVFELTKSIAQDILSAR